MRVIDLHCDTAYKMYVSDGKVRLQSSSLKVNVKKLEKADSLAQFFAMFYDLEEVNYDYNELYKKYMEILNMFKIEVDKSEGIKICTNYNEFINNNKISAFLTIEDGGIINGDLAKLDELYKEGVRLVTLTWNNPNCIGYPNTNFIYRDKGLTELGRETVRWMNELGMIVDVSHLSDNGFYDVAEISRKPFVASHSNARAICTNNRNLKDDMIKIISNAGGVIGINMYPLFLNNSGVALIDDVIKHIRYIRNIGGMDVIAIGTDFDGFTVNEENMPIKDIGEIDRMGEWLEKDGFTYEEIEKIFYKNVERVIKEVIS